MNEKNLSLVRRVYRFRQMLDNGRSIVDEIKSDADRLAEKMRRIHGQDIVVQIDHDIGLIVVRPI